MSSLNEARKKDEKKKYHDIIQKKNLISKIEKEN